MKILRYIILFLLIATNAFAVVHYVDSTSAGGDGTTTATSGAQAAFATIAAVNSHSFADGDDVYFKNGQTFTTTNGLNVDWAGVNAANYATIGCYTSTGVFTCATKPIFDGQSNTEPGIYDALIYVGQGVCSTCGFDYVEVANIQTQDALGGGILYDNGSDYAYIHHNYTKNTTQQGILHARSAYGVISYNTVERGSYNTSPGASLSVNGMGYDGWSHHNWIHHNTVYWGFEGIGVYKKSNTNIVEYNDVVDCRSYTLYSDASRFNFFRYNRVFETDEDLDTGDAALFQDNEEERDYCYTGYNRWIGNKVAGASQGFNASCSYTADSCGVVRTYVLNNTFMDNYQHNISCLFRSSYLKRL